MYIRAFFAALIKDWKEWMSGGLPAIFFAIWLIFFEPKSETAKATLWGLMSIGFVFAFYRIWVSEHKRLLSEQEKNVYPEITGEILDAYVFVRATRRNLQVTFITLVASLVNTRPVLAAVKKYELTVIVDGKAYPTQQISMRDLIVERPEFDKFGLPSLDGGAIEEFEDLEKEKYIPHERGVPFKGWLRFALVEKLVEGNMQCRLVLTITDAFGRPHLVEGKPSKWGSANVMHVIKVDI